MPIRRLGGLIKPALALTAALAVVACSSTAGLRVTRGIFRPLDWGGLGCRRIGPRGDSLAADRVPRPRRQRGPGPGGDQRVRNVRRRTLSGNAGCNDYTGSYTVDGEKLTIGPLAATKKACGPAETAVETAFMAVMGNVATYSVSGGSLELKTAEAKVGLKFAATEPAGLSKTRWVATGVNNGTGAVSSVVIGTTITAIFAEAGTVAGSGGCNDYNGPYTSDASTIKIGPLAATRKLCNSPTGVDEQETQFFAAMQAATKYTIAGSKLELRDDGGALQVSFRASLGGG